MAGRLYTKLPTFSKRYVCALKMLPLGAMEYFHDFTAMLVHSVSFTIGMHHLLQKELRFKEIFCRIILPPTCE